MNQLSFFDEPRIDPLKSAKEVLALGEHLQPYARVLMFSGGRDSLATYEVCKALGYPIDAILYINTQTGLPETTEYVRNFAMSTGLPFVEADAGSVYEDYVLRKGFFGVGTGYNSAHSFAFHTLKRSPLKAALSYHFRHGKRGRKIVLINGARTAESLNRETNMRGQYVKCDGTKKDGSPGSSNYWVSPLLDWSDDDRATFLTEQKSIINPVSQAICRSGECMCGTTQGAMARIEAAAYSPEWGRWLDDLEFRVRQKHGWGWGESMPKRSQPPVEDKRQCSLFEDDSPLCSQCRKEAIA